MAATCYKIGEIGPGGGMVFALPFTGINQTKYYYEILLEDIHDGLSTNPLPIPPGCDDSPQVQIGTEFGANNKAISTSPDFGDGKKNTDIIDAIPQPPNGGVSPYIDTHSVAATLCKNNPFGLAEDWFLPSYEEFREAATVLQADTLNLSTFQNASTVNPSASWWYLTSTASIGNTAIAATVAQPSPSPGISTQTVVGQVPVPRCRVFAVRPIRRFVCKDKGIDYDWRLNLYADGSPGILGFLEPDPLNPTSKSFTIDAYAFVMLNQGLNQSTGGTTTVIFNNSDLVIAVDSTTVGSLPAVGSQFGLVGNIPYNLLGPVVDVIDIATHPQLGVNLPTYQATAGANIDTFIVFNPSSNFSGPNGVFIGQNYPFLSFIDNLSYNVLVPNPNQTPLASGSNLEVGHHKMYFHFSEYDIRGNDMRALLCSNGHSYYTGEYFNFKFYDNFENLLIDIDYKMLGSLYNWCHGCTATQCVMPLNFSKPKLNYILPSQALTVTSNSGQQYKIMDLTPYFGHSIGGAPSEGHAYVSVTIKNPNKQWNQNFTRGNTLNLTNWLGFGNRRAKDSNNVPPEFNTQYGQFPWGVVCKPCGTLFSGCTGVRPREYMAEVDYNTFIDSCNNFPGPYTVYQPSFGTDTFGNGIGSGWTDIANAGCGGYVQAKVAGPSSNYKQDLNECFEEKALGPTSNNIKEVKLDLYSKSNEKVNETKREKFLNRRKKQDIETGPFGISGFYPLYDTIEGAILNSPTFFASRDGEDTYGYHIHEFGNKEYYMPNGLEMGVTQFHGDWDGTEIQEFSSTQQNIVVQDTLPIQNQEIETIQQENITEEPLSEQRIIPQEIPVPRPIVRPSSRSGTGGGGY
tara:strand:- start:34 stop:2592 length:2559 start_codon:yes stop_codon:yes gene_type:complete